MIIIEFPPFAKIENVVRRKVGWTGMSYRDFRIVKKLQFRQLGRLGSGWVCLCSQTVMVLQVSNSKSKA